MIYESLHFITENTGREQERISFTLFSNAAGILTKRMKLADGQLVKDASECRMSKGRAETVTLAPAQFGAFLQGLKPNQAIAHGICGRSKALIVSKAKENGARAANGLPVIAHSKEHFRYPEGPGVLMLDHDEARATCELPRCLNQTACLLPSKRRRLFLSRNLHSIYQKTSILYIKKEVLISQKGDFLVYRMVVF